MSKKHTIIKVAHPGRGAGNDPFFLGGGGGGGSLSPPRLNIFTVGNMGVMICLGQGDLRSLSASSLFVGLCLSVCPSVYGQHYSKSYDWIGCNFMEGSWD